MAETSATLQVNDDCRYALTLLPDRLFVIDGGDALVAKINDGYYVVVRPRDAAGGEPDWTDEVIPPGDNWVVTWEWVGSAEVAHFTRSG